MPADPICSSSFLVEISEDGTVFSDVSDWVRYVDFGEMTKPQQTFKVASGVTKVCVGGQDPVETELNYLYTEGDTDVYAILRDAYVAGTPIHIRAQAVLPTGKQWTCEDAVVTTFDEIRLDVDSDEPLNVVSTIVSPTIVWAAATP
jgi:hypothetical protein